MAAVSTSTRKPWIVWLRFGGGAAALLLLLLITDIRHVGQALQRATIGAVIGGVLLNLATRCAAAARTYTLSRAAGLPVGGMQTINALFISNFWSLVLPGVSAGSVSTVWRYRGHGAGVVQSLAVLSASRLVELMAFCLLALAGLATSLSAATGSRLWVTALLLAVILGVIGVLLLLRQLPEVAAPESPSGAGLLQRARIHLAAAVGLLRALPRRALAQASGWALLQGLLDALTVLVLAMALGISIGVPQALWINALSYLAILLPISAAGLGMREAAVLAALAPLGVSRPDALALALLMLAMTLFNALLGGLLQLSSPARRAVPPESLDSRRPIS